ncbi:MULTISPECIES: DUF6758 family protein [Streptomyces]|uniref:DUF6758 family protein n=1 Tax=Streptomyces evansiae TaxID=3075535 RepID=A0ABD5E5B1_9ACTN|nr:MULTISPECIES: DUF6758 family protein [unclassified Streptomyces]MDT0416611.1 DUF6758 family protein [Streptomyces sp. DSM 41982]
MRGDVRCPRCGGRVSAPGLFADEWCCPAHGAVPPLQPALPPGPEELAAVVRRAMVPVWMPWPLPVGWLYTGAASAGDARTGALATVLACAGPGPQGTSELLLVAEHPGLGLGAHLAGVTGTAIDEGKPAAGTALAAGLPVTLWRLAEAPPDRTVLIGDTDGVRLWLITRPEGTAALNPEELVLADLREAASELEFLPYGALTGTLLEGPHP